MSFLATALGQDPTRIEQAPFTENRLQQIQRQNQDRLNRNEFLRGTKDAKKQLAGLMVDPNLNPDLGNYFLIRELLSHLQNLNHMIYLVIHIEKIGLETVV